MDKQTDKKILGFCLFDPSAPSRLAINFSLILSYIAGFFLVYKSIGTAYFFFSAIPVAAIGLAGGLLCGMLSGVLFFLINSLLAYYFLGEYLPPGEALLAFSVIVTLGAIAGRLSDLVSKLRSFGSDRASVSDALSKHLFALNRTDTMITLINKEYKYEMANAAFCTAVNKIEKVIVGRSVADIWSEKTFAVIIKPYLDKCFAGEEVRYVDFFEYPVIGYRYFEVMCFPFTAPLKTSITHAMVMTRDVTDKVISEKLLKASSGGTGHGMPAPSTAVFNQDRELKYTLVRNPSPFIKGEAILGKTDFELYTAAEAKTLVGIKRRVLDFGKPAHERLKLKIDGKEKTFDLNVEPLRDISDNVTGITCSATDISLLRDSGRDTYGSEDKFVSLIDNLKSAVAVYEAVNEGEDFVIRGFNRRAEDIEKVKKEEVLGKSINVVFPYVKNFGLFDVLVKVFKTGEPHSHPATFYKDNRISGWRENHVFRLPTGEVVTVYDDITQETNAAEDLRNSEEKYRSLVENSNDPIFVVDYNGKFTFMNKMAAAYFNGMPEDFIGKRISDLFEKEFAERHMNAVRDCITSGKVLTVTNPTIINNREFWFSTSLQPVRDNTGKIYMAQVVSRNITELKVTQDSLKQSQENLKTILDNIPDMAWLKDKESRFLAVNESLLNVHGLSGQDDLLGKNDFDINPKELAERYRADDVEVMRTGKRKVVEEPHISKAGVKQWIETIKTPIRDSKGAVIGTAGIARDITMHKEMDERLRISEGKYRKFFEESADAMYITTRSGDIIEMNPVAVTIFGYDSLDDLKSVKSMALYADPGDREKVIERLKKEDSIKNYKVTMKRKNGSTFQALLNYSTVRDKNGEVLYLTGSIKDITGLDVK